MARTAQLCLVYLKNVRLYSALGALALHFNVLSSAGSSNHDSHPEVLTPRSEAPSERSTPLSPQERVHIALEALKSQHATISKSIQSLSSPKNDNQGAVAPLPATIEEDDDSECTRFSTPLTRVQMSKRTSFSTTISDVSMNEWFDAMDGYGEGAQEFILEALSPGDESELGVSNASTSSPTGTESVDSGTDDSDSEADAESVLMKLINDSRKSPSDSPTLQVVRRSQLPTGPVAGEGSMFAILKKNVGKVRRVNFWWHSVALACLTLGFIEDNVPCDF
jgi:oxysterol-binding protein-related protein 3/6/7